MMDEAGQGRRPTLIFSPTPPPSRPRRSSPAASCSCSERGGLPKAERVAPRAGMIREVLQCSLMILGCFQSPCGDAEPKIKDI